MCTYPFFSKDLKLAGLSGDTVAIKYLGFRPTSGKSLTSVKRVTLTTARNNRNELICTGKNRDIKVY